MTDEFITKELLQEYNDVLQENIPYSVDSEGNKVVTADKGKFQELKARTADSGDKSENVATTEFVRKAIVKMMFIG